MKNITKFIENKRFGRILNLFNFDSEFIEMMEKSKQKTKFLEYLKSIYEKIRKEEAEVIISMIQKYALNNCNRMGGLKRMGWVFNELYNNPKEFTNKEEVYKILDRFDIFTFGY